jgi:hypothetical protein
MDIRFSLGIMIPFSVNRAGKLQIPNSNNLLSPALSSGGGEGDEHGSS